MYHECKNKLHCPRPTTATYDFICLKKNLSCGFAISCCETNQSRQTTRKWMNYFPGSVITIKCICRPKTYHVIIQWKKKRIYENVPMKGSKFYMQVCSRPSRRNKYFDLTSDWFLSWLIMFSPIKIYWRRFWLHFKFTETIVLPHHWNESPIKNNCTFNSEMTSEFEFLDKLKYHN